MKCVYIYNPTSGKQKSKNIKDYVETRLKEKFETVVCRPTQKAGDAENFAKEACGNFDVLVVSGGDGTLNEIINGIANQPERPKIGYIPTGTTNDLAHSLKISKNPRKALDIILNGKTISHDIFRVNNRFGIYVCALGIFTSSSYKTTQKSKKKFGRLAYFKYGMKEIFNSKSFPLTLTYDEGQISDNFALAIISNSKYVAGYKVDRECHPDDNLVNLIMVKNKKQKVSFLNVLRVFKLFLFGKKGNKNTKHYAFLQLNKFKVQIPEDMTVNLDGEAGLKGSFEFQVLPNHVEIYVG